jgi:hypothetical protein
MKSGFLNDEYRIIRVESEDFNSFDLKDRVSGVPFVVCRDDHGNVTYAKAGVVETEQLRRIANTLPFNFRRLRAARA